MRSLTAHALATGIALLAVTASLAAITDKPRAALYPRARITLTQVHPVHAALNVECERCHVNTKSSRWASERLAPRMKDCQSCHPEVEGATALTPVTPTCRKCHGPLPDNASPVPGFYPQPLIRFSHAAHASTSCADCHQPQKASSAVPSLPAMRQCYDCHRRRPGRAECRVCHLVKADGRLNTNLAGRTLKPPTWLIGPNHEPGWAGDHAVTAGSASKLCGSCHEPQSCQDCHSGARRLTNLHPGDWIRTHGTATRFDNPHCQGCHRTQSFCLTCHRRAGVATDSPAATKPKIGAGRAHGTTTVPELMRRARKDITACVACHTESSCIDCHALVNPHPASWRRRCAKIAPRAEAACRKCHTEGADRCQ